MELKCGKNETLLKSWTYAKEKQGWEHKEYNLTVTDKRIISSAESSKCMDRREIYLDDVKTLEYNFAKKGAFGAMLMLILGIITSIMVIGIFLIIRAVHILKEKSFTLTITTQGEESDGINLGASSMLRSKKHGKLKVKVNKDAAIEIMNELGAIVLDKKSA